MKNIMSVDLEDYYCKLPFSEWKKYDSKLVKPTRKILDLFDKYDVKATFFTLAYIAEKHPELIEEIKSKGHEIASHGYSHTSLHNMTPEEFEMDLLKSIQILQKISGEKVRGFRAPYFSVKNNDWAFDIMKKYLDYDSSVYPVKLPHFGSLKGVANAPNHPYRTSERNPFEEDKNGVFIEIPLATLNISPIGSLPMGGGFYLRFFPIQMFKVAIKKMNKHNFPAMCYIHPQDLEPNIPRIPEYSWYSYYGLKNAIKKFEILLKSFKFSSVQDVILNC